jgi:hypothetical protein
VRPHTLDTLTDFVSGTDDINLAKTIFKAYKMAADLTDNDFANFDSTAGGTLLTAVDTTSRHFLYDTASGSLYYYADGSGVKAAVQFATLTGHPTLAGHPVRQPLERQYCPRVGVFGEPLKPNSYGGIFCNQIFSFRWL